MPSLLPATVLITSEMECLALFPLETPSSWLGLNEVTGSEKDSL